MEKPSSSKTDGPSTEAITVGISGLIIGANNAQSTVPVPQFGSISMDEISHLHGQTSGQSHASLVSSPTINGSPLHGKKAVYQPKSYGTVSAATVDAAKPTANNAALSKLLKDNLLEKFTVDNSTYSTAKIRATFYPKFENEKSDQEVISLLSVIFINTCVFTNHIWLFSICSLFRMSSLLSNLVDSHLVPIHGLESSFGFDKVFIYVGLQVRIRMIEMVSKGLATLEVRRTCYVFSKDVS